MHEPNAIGPMRQKRCYRSCVAAPLKMASSETTVDKNSADSSKEAAKNVI